MDICRECGCEFDHDEVFQKLNNEYDEIYDVVPEIDGLCKDCASDHLDNLASIGRDYMNGD